ncbi:hypothetical protein AKJ64_01595 [candidate division MSBL1 archaeon SCGC-AAA259E17]|uniref:Periplasmic copper-binding protein NosD beta helix domain-containing protein n=1 Tax=candidate division MSBL1 archaeon SCGC-AAA259E17 TaxID=1698263 RepID=A0A133UFS0_9EURY|nr:hypothetical protein AKJ64_01595 [candidate division MSBL1 archaeon SCGC-AAA259E17]
MSRTGSRTPPFERAETASYVVFRDENVIKAKNGEDGHIEFSGPDAAEVINDAIGALVAGGAVFIRDGTYEITSSINLASSVALIGQGAGTVLRVPDGHDADLRVVYGSGIDHVTVADLRIDGNKANQTAGAMTGIYLDTVTDSKVRGCWVEDVYGTGATMDDGTGIYLTGSSRNVLSQNASEANSIIGITLDTSDNNEIAGNLCRNNAGPGIYLDSSSDNTITGNTSRSNDSSGIYLASSSDYNLITDNSCCQAGFAHGIYIDGSSYNTVTGNLCRANAQVGIWLANSSNTVVTGNASIGNSQAADDTYAGIYTSGAAPDYNLIQGNLVRHDGGANQHNYGVDITSGTGNLVTNNDLYRSGRTASVRDTGGGTIIRLNRGVTPPVIESLTPFILETPQTGLVADTTGVKFNSNAVTLPSSGYASIAIEGTWTASQTDSVTAIELYDQTAGAVLASVSGNMGTNVKSGYASFTAGNTVNVRVNVTTASATGGATTDCYEAVVYLRYDLS